VVTAATLEATSWAAAPVARWHFQLPTVVTCALNRRTARERLGQPDRFDLEFVRVLPGRQVAFLHFSCPHM
jgi:hypothetical protein